MSEYYATDFADESAFERYVLQQALPLVPHDAGSGSAVYDVAADQISWNMVVHDTIGLTVEGAVDQLGIRPLCFGAAWKIADLLLEHALSASGLSPARGTRWTIAEKARHARKFRGRAAPLRPTAISGRDSSEPMPDWRRHGTRSFIAQRRSTPREQSPELDKAGRHFPQSAEPSRNTSAEASLLLQKG